MPDRDGQDEPSIGRTEERQEPTGRADWIHSVHGTSEPVSRIITEVTENDNDIGSSQRSDETRIIAEAWLEPIDETSPRMRMAGPEAEKKEVQSSVPTVLAWDNITKIIDKDKEDIKGKNDLTHFFDIVDRPMHYATGNIECIDAIEAQLSPEEFRGYLKGNIIKYLWREKHKGGIQSLKKAEWYLKRLLSLN